MPHLVILYTGQLDHEVSMTAPVCWPILHRITRWPMAAQPGVRLVVPATTLLCT